MLSIVKIGDTPLTPRDVWLYARELARKDGPGELLLLSGSAQESIRKAAAIVANRARSAAPVYGINTGVGALRNVILDPGHLAAFQPNLLRSHACGVGDPLPRAVVAAMWIHLLNSAAQGHRGLRLETVDAIVTLLNRGILPQVPARGSVGASGDLAPAAHAALLLIGEGQCSIAAGGDVHILPAIEGLRRAGLEPLSLMPKEALSLMNGTQLTTALACQVWAEADRLWRTSILALAFSTVALRPNPTVTRPELLELHHPATLYAGLRKQEWLAGANLPFRNHQQDPYSFRCAPQVHGAIRKEIDQCEEWITEELAATTDNPIVLAETEEFAYGGNFHAIYPARVLDRLASALTQLATISERRINVAMDGRKTGLPDFLTPESGLNSGLMMAQTTAAALASECKSLSFPASVDSIPTNCDQEDHVSMGPAAGLKALQICRNVRDVLAIEILAAYQATHLRAGVALPPRLRCVCELLSNHVRPIERDRIFSEDIRKISQLVEDEILLAASEHTVTSR